MTAEVHYLYRKSWCIERAVETYARHLGIPVDEIPPNEQLAVMYACVDAVKGALADLEHGMAS